MQAATASMQDEDPAALADGEEEVWHDACESHELEPAGHAVDGPARPSQPLDADGALPAHPLPASLRAAAVGSLRERVLASPGADACAELEDRSPATLERFLRARDFNVDVSLALFLDHRAWRQSFGWAVPAAAVPAREFAQHKVAIQALSRDHRHPLLLLVARNHDPHGRVVEDIKRFVVHTLDRVCDHLTPGGQFVVLVDFVGMTSKNADAKTLLACFDILQKRYVERVRYMWFCNPPTLFWALWNVVRPFVAAKTRDKIQFVYGQSVKACWAELYAAQDIPADLGGEGKLRPLSPLPLPWEKPGLPRMRRY